MWAYILQSSHTLHFVFSGSSYPFYSIPKNVTFCVASPIDAFIFSFSCWSTIKLYCFSVQQSSLIISPIFITFFWKLFTSENVLQFLAVVFWIQEIALELRIGLPRDVLKNWIVFIAIYPRMIFCIIEKISKHEEPKKEFVLFGWGDWWKQFFVCLNVIFWVLIIKRTKNP